MVKFVDTNVLLRFVTNDVPDLASQAQAMVNAAASAELVITDAVLAEVCQVLEFNQEYRLDRQLVGKALTALLALPAFEVSRLAREAATYYIKYPKLDFVDCLLAAQAGLHSSEIITFDKRLQKTIANAATSKG
jgi:predicted nucleic acid-binding protein